jgi:hypothetical protein
MAVRRFEWVCLIAETPKLDVSTTLTGRASFAAAGLHPAGMRRSVEKHIPQGDLDSRITGSCMVIACFHS